MPVSSEEILTTISSGNVGNRGSVGNYLRRYSIVQILKLDSNQEDTVSRGSMYKRIDAYYVAKYWVD